MQQTPNAAAAAAHVPQPLDPWTPAHYPPPEMQSQLPRKGPMTSIISPEDAKKMRKMQIVNLVCTMLHLGCAVAMICVVRFQLVDWFYVDAPVTHNGYTFSSGYNYVCLAATSPYPSTCGYAYALASISIWLSFMISVMVCITLDCCGMGRMVEAMFDMVGVLWWVAGTVVLAVRAAEANRVGLPRSDARNAVVAMAAVSTFLYLLLLLSNLVLMKTLGKTYKRAAEQLHQQFVSSAPVAAPMGAPLTQPQAGAKMAPGTAEVGQSAV